MSHGRMREVQAAEIARKQARQQQPHQGRRQTNDRREPSEALKRHAARMQKLCS